MYLFVVPRSQYFNQASLICSSTLKTEYEGGCETVSASFNTEWERITFLAYFDCIMDFFGIVVGPGSHQTDNEALKFSRELIFEIINQVLMKENFSDAGLKTAILSF